MAKIEDAAVKDKDASEAKDSPAKRPVRHKDTSSEKQVNKGSSSRKLKHQRSTDSSESETTTIPKMKSVSLLEEEGKLETPLTRSESKRSLQRTDSERSSTKRKGKKISPPESTPEIAGGG